MNNPAKILSDLIAFKTDTYVKTNKPLVDYICKILDSHKSSYKRITNDNSQLENIIAGINIHQWENIPDGLILSGHMDTVSANPKNWDFNPFSAHTIDNKIYGRGSVDMKYFIAVILSLLEKLKQTQKKIFLVFTCDEETEAIGIQKILSFF